jgi:phenylalanyl-tRNA synthetase alpha subunit
MKAALPKEPTDFTLPGRRRVLGKLHPLTQVTEDIVRSFRKIGFVVADGPEIEDEYHCFDALNTPADHPARDTQDTFYLESNGRNPGLQIATIAGATSPSSGGLELLGKQRKESAESGGPLRAERAGASESLGRGEGKRKSQALSGSWGVNPKS